MAIDCKVRKTDFGNFVAKTLMVIWWLVSANQRRFLHGTVSSYPKVVRSNPAMVGNLFVTGDPT